MAIPFFVKEGEPIQPSEDVLMQDGRRANVVGGPLPDPRDVDEWVPVPRVDHEGVPIDDDLDDAPTQFRVVPWRAEERLRTVEVVTASNSTTFCASSPVQSTPPKVRLTVHTESIDSSEPASPSPVCSASLS